MHGDATVLGIHPPHTIRINQEGWERDWPFETIHVERQAIIVHYQGRRLVRYEYRDAIQLLDGTWQFTAAKHDFTVEAGPVTAPSMDTGPPR